MHRRHFLAAATSLAIPGISLAADAPRALRIGYQKNGVLLLAKQQRLFETRFAALGMDVKFVEFSSGPPLLEALNVGAIDYGTTGDAPPIFAQAARANLVYVAAQPSAGSSSAILIRDPSPIRSLADRKGRKVGFTKASSAHNVIVAALEKAGLRYEDISPLYLQPADAAAAFARGAIDAWSIWDPYFAIAEAQPGTRVLADGKDIVRQNSYFLANREFTTKYPSIVAAINEELAKVAVWALAHRDEASRAFAEATGIDLEIMARVVARSEFAVTPVTDAIVAEQQSVADRFHRLALIPAPIAVRDIVWVWTPAS